MKRSLKLDYNQTNQTFLSKKIIISNKDENLFHSHHFQIFNNLSYKLFPDGQNPENGTKGHSNIPTAFIGLQNPFQLLNFFFWHKILKSLTHTHKYEKGLFEFNDDQK